MWKFIKNNDFDEDQAVGKGKGNGDEKLALLNDLPGAPGILADGFPSCLGISAADERDPQRLGPGFYRGPSGPDHGFHRNTHDSAGRKENQLTLVPHPPNGLWAQAIVIKY